MRLRECVISVSGRTCLETTNISLFILPYIASRTFELILRDIVNKWKYIPDIEAACIDFS